MRWQWRWGANALLLILIAGIAMWYYAAQNPVKAPGLPKPSRQNEGTKISARESKSPPVIVSPIELIVLPTPPSAQPPGVPVRAAATPTAEAVVLPPPPRSVTSAADQKSESGRIATPAVVPLRPTATTSQASPKVSPMRQADLPASEPKAVRPLRPQPISAAEPPPGSGSPLRPQEKPQQPVRELPDRASEPATKSPSTSKTSPPGDQPSSSEPSPKSVAEGRSLLRVLERGSGPSVTIAWPASAAEREELYSRFVACFGMRVALVDRDGRLYTAAGVRGSPWAINLDQYSGFIRQPDGDIAAEEEDEIKRIHAYHGSVVKGSPVRIFPRRIDAVLIGGLRQAAGPNYLKTKAVRADYRLVGERIMVGEIKIDGIAVAGTVDLSSAAACRGRRVS